MNIFKVAFNTGAFDYFKILERKGNKVAIKILSEYFKNDGKYLNAKNPFEENTDDYDSWKKEYESGVRWAKETCKRMS